jgi:hypothetical protein
LKGGKISTTIADYSKKGPNIEGEYKMKKLLPIVLGLLLVLLFSAHGEAVTLNFDDLVGGTELLNSTYQGVYITSPDAIWIEVFGGNEAGAGASSFPNSIGADLGKDDSFGLGTVQLIFPELVNFVQVTGGDQGEPDQESFTIEAYDSSGNLLASFLTPLFGGNPINQDGYYADIFTGSVAASNIAYVLLKPTSPSMAGITWDDVIYQPQPVPEPSTMLLLGSGLLGIFGLRKKFKK